MTVHRARELYASDALSAGDIQQLRNAIGDMVIDIELRREFMDALIPPEITSDSSQ
jgi:hypothetical protein